MNKLNLKQKKLPERIIDKEKEEVTVPYQEIQKDIEDVKVKYALKIPRNNFKIKNDTFLKYYLSMILSCNFSPSSSLYEQYKNNNIIINMSTSVHIVDNYVIIVINASCNDSKIFLDNLSKDIKKLTLDKIKFERKKKLFLKSFIVDFDNIEDIEYTLCDSILLEGKINFNEYNDINNMNYETAKQILKEITYNNFSIIKTIK